MTRTLGAACFTNIGQLAPSGVFWDHANWPATKSSELKER